MTERLRVLAVATYPYLAAATRHRVSQYIPLLAEEAVDVDLHPFLSNSAFAGLYKRQHIVQTSLGILAGVGRRIIDATRLRSYDLVFVQREAALVGPPLFEWLVHRKLPMVLDLDDSTYVERRSEVYGALAKVLKFHGKTSRMIPWADHAVCGNPTIARYMAERNIEATVLPTIVDVSAFTPRDAAVHNEPLVIGWLGTHSTYSYLRMIIPALRRVSLTHRFRLRIVGAGKSEMIDGLDVEFLPWSLDREVPDIQSFDIGIYPIVADEWGSGKSGFKSIQYLSCGLPFVASPVGVVSEIGIPGETHLQATTEDEWVHALERLLTDAALRRRMGVAGRQYAVEHYSTRASARTLAQIFRKVTEKKKAAH
ncbi:MAG TPA: glycosyltransferase family 4 protein [Thermoanaerobaculia bacterium]|nr:glycosyltransferase family 4 protein [Thermoanaerobaculia bacterium]